MNLEWPGRPVFETGQHLPTVTFDDGKVRLNLPYHDYVECCWSYLEPDTVTVKIDKVVVVLRGHNMEPLFDAFGEQSLKSVKARPELALDPKQQANSYVTEITFLPLLSTPAVNLTKREARSKGQLYLKPSGWVA
jgi:chloramphenicol O-acetyltransferase